MLVFYSRNPEQAKALASYCEEQKIRLLAQSFISFEPIDFAIPRLDYEVVFFSSPRSVDFFLRKAQIPKDCAIACIGSQTKIHLEELGYAVAFHGKQSSNPELVAEAYKTWLKNRFVLFPISDMSNRSISKTLDESQYQEIVVYRTISKSFQLETIPDILIFSSPSNAQCYLDLNLIHPHQKVLCFGETSFQFLNNQGVHSEITSEPSETGVIKKLDEILKK